ncbi:LptA/OstA family protein [Aestuariivirga sp.]|uniref:LptA/OstA family protein n=1 Tax=Aestuariivirga sp. TaxID=2650926 RepID=UPI0039E5B473
MRRQILWALPALALLALPAWPETAPATPAKTTTTTTTTDKKTKPDLPVDIESDSTVIHDKDKIAIFTGHVIAKRGDTTLNADKLQVKYSDAKQPDGTTKTQADHLDFSGNVVITNPKEKITGDSGTLEVQTNILEVMGNVTVVQGQTVLKGQHLHANLDTNQMEMTGGRVKGSFVPK